MVGCCLFKVFLYGRCIWNFKIGSVFSSAKLKLEVDKFCFLSKYRIFLLHQQIGKAPAKGIVSWKLSSCRWICLCLDVIRQMSYMLKRFKNRQNSSGGCFPKICTTYHYCKMYRNSFKRCQIIFFHKRLNVRM